MDLNVWRRVKLAAKSGMRAKVGKMASGYNFITWLEKRLEGLK